MDDSHRRKFLDREILAIVGEQIDVNWASSMMFQFKQSFVDLNDTHSLIVGILDDGCLHTELYYIIRQLPTVDVLSYQMSDAIIALM